MIYFLRLICGAPLGEREACAERNSFPCVLGGAFFNKFLHNASLHLNTAAAKLADVNIAA